MKHIIIIFIFLSLAASGQDSTKVFLQGDTAVFGKTGSDTLKLRIEKVSFNKSKVSSFRVCILKDDSIQLNCLRNPQKGDIVQTAEKGKLTIDVSVNKWGRQQQVQQQQQVSIKKYMAYKKKVIRLVKSNKIKTFKWRDINSGFTITIRKI